MKYVDATTYQLLSDEIVNARLNVVREVPQMVIYDLNVDFTLCSDEQFLEVCCNVLVIH